MVTSGIDKTFLSGILVESIDFNKLNEMKKSGKVRLEHDIDKSFYRLRNGDSFEYIKIRDDNIFKVFQAGYKLKEGRCICYAFMDLSIAPLAGNNLIPLTIGAYRKQLVKIFEYLENVYGVRCNLDNIKFKVLELNTNIQLDHAFNEYIRILQILMSIAPKVYKLEHTDKNRRTDTIDNIVLKNKSLQVKFYNKSKQLKEIYKLDIEKNLLRIEYTFLTDTKIKKVFGTNSVNELSDQQIKDFIINQFNNDFAKPYDKLKRDNQVKLKRLIDVCKHEHKNWINKTKEHFWLEESERKVPTLLDIEDFLELVKVEDGINYAKNRRRILKDFPKTYFNQHEKYEEIFKKVSLI